VFALGNEATVPALALILHVDSVFGRETVTDVLRAAIEVAHWPPSAHHVDDEQLRESKRHDLLTDALTLHFVELPKIPEGLLPSANADPVLKWGWFFKAGSDEERHLVAMSDPTLREAEVALRNLSDDPVAREYAHRRELELIHFQNQLTRRFEQGRAQGVEQGRMEATLGAITHSCGAFGIELNDTRRRELSELDFDTLQNVLSLIIERRGWPL
jgi:hypothetical protein